MYGFLADVVVAIHLAYVSFVIFGQLAIILGALLRWQWVRNLTFRVLHVIMICVVAFEAVVDYKCPLTTWEDRLRELAGQHVEAGTFMGRCMDALMFPDWPEEVYTPVYIGFAVLVILTFIVAPPRRKKTVAAYQDQVSNTDAPILDMRAQPHSSPRNL